ncbi:SDR family NAD(P)-dependent oxidoreductase [Rathayibacter sp. VKM Ac-2856]|uniref:oxidoreductase n=1 Tax=unclassified Rathayibacter TaxID=2609250 RepID=UPI001563A8F3|nr:MULTISPECIES: oxidoreductase [unclassified Rathayibacter]NQX04878.1 SDR family NAD(P)-dependent oxidoreductase [Rathayibacter sp. VKM Ac-2858]NQX20046.1 SDR family NAD(P)-dependent oxidoreductase [Rathayibacter sp. VKM Ac-2856]
MTSWSAADIPDQTGRTFVVTGANSGLGEATARALAQHGARVVLACRTVEKGERAAERMGGDVVVRRLDLADLSSVREFAEATGPIDVLVNNAGIMAVPEGRTKDGFELQFGTNFLGPFALTGLLLPRIADRVVSLSSLAHRFGTLDFDDLNWEHRRYSAWPAYGQSKLADLVFSFELHRRLRRAGSSVGSMAAHPGMSLTELHTHAASGQGALMGALMRTVGQSGDEGALPTLLAATSPEARSGAFYGPSGLGEVRGAPRQVNPNRAARDRDTARRLWDSAVELTGVSPLDAS